MSVAAIDEDELPERQYVSSQGARRGDLIEEELELDGFEDRVA